MTKREALVLRLLAAYFAATALVVLVAAVVIF
jgi:hypothetical protein